MPIIEFVPVDPSLPDWEASDLKGRCRVHAPDEQRAMHYLRAYLDPNLYQLVGEVTGTLPDYCEGLIEIDIGRDGGVTRVGPAGYGVANIGREKWVSFNIDKLAPFDQDTNDGSDAPREPGTIRQELPANQQGSAPSPAKGARHTYLTPGITTYTAGKTISTSEVPEHRGNEDVKIDVPADELTITHHPPTVEAGAVSTDEIRKSLDAVRQQFQSQPHEIIVRAKIARANTTAALELLEQVRGNSEQHAKIKDLLTEQIEYFDTIENALSEDDGKEAAFNRYADLLHKSLTNLLEVISEKGVIRGALAVGACALVMMTAIGGDFVIGPIVAASIIGFDPKTLVKLVETLGKLRKPQKNDEEE